LAISVHRAARRAGGPNAPKCPGRKNPLLARTVEADFAAGGGGRFRVHSRSAASPTLDRRAAVAFVDEPIEMRSAPDSGIKVMSCDLIDGTCQQA